MYAEPKECVEDIAMAQWEEASVITVRGTVRSEGSTPNPVFLPSCMSVVAPTEAACTFEDAWCHAREPQ